jgi:hypothetical protein
MFGGFAAMRETCVSPRAPALNAILETTTRTRCPRLAPMKTLTLVSLVFAASMLQAAGPNLPEFNSKLIERPPLALADILKGGITMPPLQLNGPGLPFAKVAAKPAPAKATPEYHMRIVKPNDAVDYKMQVQTPDPAIDFKLKVMPVEADAAK